MSKYVITEEAVDQLLLAENRKMARLLLQAKRLGYDTTAEENRIREIDGILTNPQNKQTLQRISELASEDMQLPLTKLK
ncbi:hypothetical protein ACTXG6_06040 [Pseudonocardia sp. Cha107L01]|uniref:hypothetical protein n=1 Tax=Pseudonocardia sp. Cha107L01 TaxID=3457576 RepID=UPI00403E8CC5